MLGDVVRYSRSHAPMQVNDPVETRYQQQDELFWCCQECNPKREEIETWRLHKTSISKIHRKDH